METIISILAMVILLLILFIICKDAASEPKYKVGDHVLFYVPRTAKTTVERGVVLETIQTRHTTKTKKNLVKKVENTYVVDKDDIKYTVSENDVALIPEGILE